MHEAGALATWRGRGGQVHEVRYMHAHAGWTSWFFFFFFFFFAEHLWMMIVGDAVSISHIYRMTHTMSL